MTEEMYLVVLGLAGLAIHHLKQWSNAAKQGQHYNLSKSLPTLILSAITTSLLIHLRHDIEGLFVVTPFSAVVLGYFGNSVFFSFVNAKKPKTDD